MEGREEHSYRDCAHNLLAVAGVLGRFAMTGGTSAAGATAKRHPQHPPKLSDPSANARSRPPAFPQPVRLRSAASSPPCPLRIYCFIPPQFPPSLSWRHTQDLPMFSHGDFIVSDDNGEAGTYLQSVTY